MEWYYNDESGEKVGPITSAQLKKLAILGSITPDTMLTTDAGKVSLASNVKGLEFPDPIVMVPVPLPQTANIGPPPDVDDTIGVIQYKQHRIYAEISGKSFRSLGNLFGVFAVLSFLSMIVFFLFGIGLFFAAVSNESETLAAYAGVFFANSFFCFLNRWLMRKLKLIINQFADFLPEMIQKEIRKMELLERMASQK